MCTLVLQERPYHDDSTASRLLSEVKHRRARLVLRWGTTLESWVLFFCHFWTFLCFFISLKLQTPAFSFSQTPIFKPTMSPNNSHSYSLNTGPTFLCQIMHFAIQFTTCKTTIQNSNSDNVNHTNRINNIPMASLFSFSNAFS